MEHKKNGTISKNNGGIYEKYANFFLHNIEEVGTLERTLRTLLFFVPGRFKESEVKLEFGKHSFSFYLLTLLFQHTQSLDYFLWVMI